MTYLTDGLGSSVALANASGVVQTSYGYDATGNTTTSGTANTNSFEYMGRQADATGYYYYRARYYNPQIGRFLAEDPTEFAGGDANIYRYVRGNPINFNDPSGLCPSSPHCRLPDGSLVPYKDLGGGLAAIGSGDDPTDLGAGVGVGQAVNGTAMPTVSKTGGVAGGGVSGPVTSPASGLLRGMTGGARYNPLRPLTGTNSVGGSIGRALPIFGSALSLLDLLLLLNDLNNAPVCIPEQRA